MSQQHVHTKQQCDHSSTLDNHHYSIRELICNLRDAIVNITGKGILTDLDGKSRLINRRGNGFFIKGHYIICPSDLVLIYPAFLDASESIKKVKGVERGSDITQHISTPKLDHIARMSKILVDISNVNGCNKAFSYEADLVGVDGASNIAVLRINMTASWNMHNPPITGCHPVLQWGKSRSTCPGDKIFVIGDITSATMDLSLAELTELFPRAENAVAIGNIADNRYVFPNGQIVGELLLLSNLFSGGSQQGLPVITMDGRIIGMSIYVASYSGFNVALSEFFMRRPVKTLIRSYIDNCVSENHRRFIHPISDHIGTYYKFTKSWLGLCCIPMSQDDFDTDIIISPTVPSSFIRVPNTKLSHLESKEIVGYRILKISDGISNSSTRSPIYGIISVGDIITHINGCPLGDRKCQISPSLVMWRVRPGDVITIIYKKQSEMFGSSHDLSVSTDFYDPLLDYPFYSENILHPFLPITI